MLSLGLAQRTSTTQTLTNPPPYSPSYQTDVFQKLVNIIMLHNVTKLKKTLTDDKITNLETLHDIYRNNLLHMAVLLNKYDFVQFLLEKKLNPKEKNAFNDSAWQTAINTHDEKMVQIFIDFEIAKLGLENIQTDKIKKELETIKKLNTELHETNIETTKLYDIMNAEYKTAKKETEILKGENKRLRKDYEDTIIENDKEKNENKKLKTSLQISQDNLMKVLKK